MSYFIPYPNHVETHTAIV